MPLYESVFIARQDIPASEVDTLTETYSGIIADNGGAVQRSEYWGLRNLAYRIKKNRKGHYVMFHIDAPSPAVQEMERNMRINEEILRYMTIRVEEFDAEPSVIMQSRGSRDDRGRRDDRDRGRPRPSEPKAEAKPEPKPEPKPESADSNETAAAPSAGEAADSQDS